MKKTVLAMSMAAALTVTSFAASAAINNTWYIGIQGGWAHTFLDNSSDIDDSDNNAWGYGAYVGYNFTDWFALEGAYKGFSDFGLDVNGSDHELNMWGPELALRFAYPLDKNGSDIYFRAGAAWTFTRDGHKQQDQFDPLLGLGVQWAINKRFALRAGYDFYFNAYDPDDSPYSDAEGSLGLLYVGVQVTIGAKDEEPVKQEPQKVRIRDTRTLDSGMLFPFDGSTLTEEGKAAIAEVASEASDLTDPTFEVYGYTDRIGSDAYNLKLSQKRADAVANEMRNDGLADQITNVEGRGKAHPVTGNQCDGISNKAKLIECLAPDRRVEVVINGEKVVEQEFEVNSASAQ